MPLQSPATPAETEDAVALEVHKFGGASLADAAAFRHAVDDHPGRGAPCVVVVSAPAGVTDVLLGLARRAPRPSNDGLRARHARRLRDRYQRHRCARAVGSDRAAQGGRRRDRRVARRARARCCASLVVLKELTPRTSDFMVARGERLSARALRGRARARRAHVALRRRAGGHLHRRAVRRRLARPRCCTDSAARKVLRPLLDAGRRARRPGLHRRAALEDDGTPARRDRAVATLGRGGSDLTATLLGRALGAREVSLWKDVPGPAHGRPARRARRARHPAAARARGGGAGLLRRQGAAPARADPASPARAIPVFVRPFADPRAAGHRDLGAPHARQVPGQGAVGASAARRCSPSRATACWACPASRRARSRRCSSRASASR